VSGAPRLRGPAARVRGWLEHEVALALPNAGNRRHGILHPARHIPGHRAAGRRQRHVDLDIALRIDLEAIDQAKLVDVDRNLRVEHGFQRGNEIVLELVVFWHCGGFLRRLSGRFPLLVLLNLFSHFGHLPQANMSCALCSASTSRSTSSVVLYMANEARAVEVTPYRAKRGSAQWVPALMATP